MSNLLPKHYIKPHTMGILTKSNPFFRPFPVQYEPMRRDRWVMTVHNQQGSQRFFVKNDNGIRMEEIPYLTTSTWVRPRVSWDPVTIEIIDYIGQNSTHECFRDWMMSHAEIITGRQGYASDYKRTVELEKLDPVGSTIEKWILNGTFITEMNHEIVYDREMGNMKVTLQFDNALLTI